MVQIPIYISEELNEKINQRLPRNIKISALSRWLLTGVVLTPAEIAEVCRMNEDEAREIGPYLQDAFTKLFEAGKEIDKTKK